jgi:hypothetical protein
MDMTRMESLSVETSALTVIRIVGGQLPMQRTRKRSSRKKLVTRMSEIDVVYKMSAGDQTRARMPTLLAGSREHGIMSTANDAGSVMGGVEILARGRRGQDQGPDRLTDRDIAMNTMTAMRTVTMTAEGIVMTNEEIVVMIGEMTAETTAEEIITIVMIEETVGAIKTTIVHTIVMTGRVAVTAQSYPVVNTMSVLTTDVRSQTILPRMLENVTRSATAKLPNANTLTMVLLARVMVLRPALAA